MDYTAEDEVIIKEKWDDLLLSCTKICKNDEDWNFIKRAFFLAKEAHQGVRRRSGEPYLLHPIAVAKIVIEEIGLGVKSVVAALLHDVVEDTEYTVEDMERIFGPKIASMVDGLTKMSGVFNAETSEQAEYFRKVLLTLSDDVRVILIKIADRLHNMRTLGAMPMNKQIKITGETIYLFAPLAYRLGLYSIKSELEDLCMKYRFPQQYAEITQKLNETEASRQEFISKFNAPIIAGLNRDNINYEISGRVKSVYSIWSKMQRKQIPFEEIYDLFAIRIVFKPLPFPSEKTQCWQVYSTITDIYTPKPDRLRIFHPKSGRIGNDFFTGGKTMKKIREILLFSLCVLLFSGSLTAAAADGAPIAENLEIMTYRGISVGGQLKAFDPEGEEVHFRITTEPRKGTLTLEENGEFVYTPAEGKRGLRLLR